MANVTQIRMHRDALHRNARKAHKRRLSKTSKRRKKQQNNPN